MTVAYVDTSVVVALTFEEPGGARTKQRLEGFSRLLSSNLLEAELRAACAREACGFSESLVANLTWVLPDRSLAPELAAALTAGYLRGADLWHVASALYVAPSPADLCFLTLDERQRSVAATLGFRI